MANSTILYVAIYYLLKRFASSKRLHLSPSHLACPPCGPKQHKQLLGGDPCIPGGDEWQHSFTSLDVKKEAVLAVSSSAGGLLNWSESGIIRQIVLTAIE